MTTPAVSAPTRLPNYDTAGVTAPSIPVNRTKKAELLNRAKEAIEAGDQSLHDAADALGLAQEDHSANQREMAEAVGKSAAWVNKLLKWRRSGYEDHSPFGPTTKRGRVEHAQQRAKAAKPRKAGIASKTDDNDSEGSTEQREASAYTPSIPASKVTVPLVGFKSAVDYWFPKMNSSAKREAVTYATTKAGVD